MAKEEERNPAVAAWATKKPQNKDNNNKAGGGEVPSRFAINFIVYVLCIVSLGATVYSNVRLRTHDQRIRSLEEIISSSGGAGDGVDFHWPRSVNVVAQPDILNSAFDNDNNNNYANLNRAQVNVDNKNNNNDMKSEASASNQKTNLQRKAAPEELLLLERLQHQVAGIQQRLRRREVAQLQPPAAGVLPLIRPQRQATVSDCLCPAGELIIIVIIIIIRDKWGAMRTGSSAEGEKEQIESNQSVWPDLGYTFTGSETERGRRRWGWLKVLHSH